MAASAVTARTRTSGASRTSKSTCSGGGSGSAPLPPALEDPSGPLVQAEQDPAEEQHLEHGGQHPDDVAGPARPLPEVVECLQPLDARGDGRDRLRGRVPRDGRAVAAQDVTRTDRRRPRDEEGDEQNPAHHGHHGRRRSSSGPHGPDATAPGRAWDGQTSGANGSVPGTSRRPAMPGVLLGVAQLALEVAEAVGAGERRDGDRRQRAERTAVRVEEAAARVAGDAGRHGVDVPAPASARRTQRGPGLGREHRRRAQAGLAVGVDLRALRRHRWRQTPTGPPKNGTLGLTLRSSAAFSRTRAKSLAAQAFREAPFRRIARHEL